MDKFVAISAVNFEVGVYFSPDEMSPIYPKLEDLVNGVNVNETRNSSMNLDSEVVASFQWKTPILAGIAVLLNLLTFGRIIYYYVRAHSLFKFSHYHKWVIPITSTSQKSWKYLFFLSTMMIEQIIHLISFSTILITLQLVFRYSAVKWNLAPAKQKSSRTPSSFCR